MPTKDELEQENEELRARVAELEQDQAATAERDLTATGTDRPKPKRPDYLSEGERQDLEAHGVTNSPFTGEPLDAITEGVEPGNPVAVKAAKKRHAERQHGATESVPNEWPISGPPPAAGGDTDPLSAV